jgi:ABC-type transporter Mla subunit MlaD
MGNAINIIRCRSEAAKATERGALQMVKVEDLANNIVEGAHLLQGTLTSMFSEARYADTDVRSQIQKVVTNLQDRLNKLETTLDRGIEEWVNADNLQKMVMDALAEDE